GNPAFQTLRRSFQPDDLMPELTAAGVHCTVTIEAADNLAENEALLANSHTYDWIAGVVGWAPLAHPSEVERTLDVRADEPALVGIRHLINVEPDPDWIIRPDVLKGLRVLAARGLAFDYVGILPRVDVMSALLADIRQLRRDQPRNAAPAQAGRGRNCAAWCYDAGCLCRRCACISDGGLQEPEA